MKTDYEIRKQLSIFTKKVRLKLFELFSYRRLDSRKEEEIRLN
jgi:hypothetical protein